VRAAAIAAANLIGKAAGPDESGGA